MVHILHFRASVQVALGGGYMVSSSYVYRLVNALVGRDNIHLRMLQRVKTILGPSRSRMQHPIAACTRAQSLTRPCPCAICIWFLHPAAAGAQDGHDPLQLALVVSFLYQLAQCAHKTFCNQSAISHCNLYWWCFSSNTGIY